MIALGCTENFDTSRNLLRILEQNGYEECPRIADSDLILINTCGFIEKARNETLEIIEKVLKKCKSHIPVIAFGCMTKLNSELILKTFSNVPNLEVYSLESSLYKRLKIVNFPGVQEFISEKQPVKKSVCISLSKGCDRNCSFCVIPKLIGRQKSKLPKEIINEFYDLRKKGTFEFTLFSQNLADYGTDLWNPSFNFIELIKQLLDNEDNFWLRLSTIYPEGINDTLIDLIVRDPRICRYLFIPFQHVSNNLLNQMKLGLTQQCIIKLITRLREKIPSLVLGTNFIVGFPGETESDFETLVQFIQDYPFERINFFGFSQEPVNFNSEAKPVDKQTIENRLTILRDLQMKITQKFLSQLVEKELMVFIEGYLPESKKYLKGRYYGQLPKTDGEIFVKSPGSEMSFGQLNRVKILSVLGNNLVGKLATN